MENQQNIDDAPPLTDDEIKMHAAHEGEACELLLRWRRDGQRQMKELRTKHAAALAALRAAAKAGGK